MTAARRAIHQGFLPTQGKSRAFVWKYSPVNWGRRPRHFHIEPELNLIASGHAVFGIGETVVRVSRGDLLGFPPAQDHVLLDASPDLYLFAIGMAPALCASGGKSGRLHGQIVALEPDLHDEGMLPLHLRLGSDEFRILVNRASAIVDRDGVEQPCAELWDHAHWLGRLCTARSPATMHVLTRRALSAVSRAPHLELQALARLLRLIGLMDGGSMTLAAAAESSGFGSYSQCHRIFQAELGCSPRRFFHAGLREQMQRAYDP